MRNKRLLAISAIAISASVFMTACSFGGDGKTDKTETVEVTDTPTPEVTQAPTETPVPTIAPMYRVQLIHQQIRALQSICRMLHGQIRQTIQICSASNHQSREIS